MPRAQQIGSGISKAIEEFAKNYKKHASESTNGAPMPETAEPAATEERTKKAKKGTTSFDPIGSAIDKLLGTPTPTWRSLYPVHPCADAFPMMGDAELGELAADIKAHGLQQPVVLWKDPQVSTKPETYFVLDGRNRLEALARLDVVIPSPDDPREMVDLPGGQTACIFEIANYHSKQWTATHVHDPAEFVIGANIRRRHLTKEQQAELIVKTIEASTIDRAPVARSFNPIASKKGGSTKDPVLAKAVAAAQKHGISRRTVQTARAKIQGKHPAPRKSPGLVRTPPTTEAIPLGTSTRRAADPMAVHYSSKTDEHYTPAEVIKAVVACLGSIDLDPCSNADGKPHVPATRHFTKADNGLTKPWHGRVFMNPPYGENIDDWVLKLTTEYHTKHVAEAIALVPGKMDTGWFSRFRDYPFCAVRGRLTFVGNQNPAPFPSFVVYLGKRRATFYRSFAKFGDMWIRVGG